MATIEENIQKIRHDAIYGQEMRTAIADGIQQLDSSVVQKAVYATFTKIRNNDYKLTLTNATN